LLQQFERNQRSEYEIMTRKRGRPYIDLKGQRFGRWLVVSRSGSANYRAAKWFCRCDCGAERNIEGNSLRKGISKGCSACGAVERWKNGVYDGVKLGPKPKARLKSEAKRSDDELQRLEELA
jgi:hypothetical protein